MLSLQGALAKELATSKERLPKGHSGKLWNPVLPESGVWYPTG